MKKDDVEKIEKDEWFIDVCFGCLLILFGLPILFVAIAGLVLPILSLILVCAVPFLLIIVVVYIFSMLLSLLGNRVFIWFLIALFLVMLWITYM